MLQINQESIDFLYNHSFLSKNKFNLAEDYLQLNEELDDVLSFIHYNTTEKNVKNYVDDSEETGLVYDSIFFAIVEHHIANALTVIK